MFYIEKSNEIFGQYPVLFSQEYFDDSLPFGTLVYGQMVNDQIDTTFVDMYGSFDKKDYYIALGHDSLFIPIAGAVKLFKYFIDRQIICKIKLREENPSVDFEKFRLQPIHCVRLLNNLELVMNPIPKMAIAGFVDVQKLTNTVFSLALLVSTYLCYTYRNYFDVHYGSLVCKNIFQLNEKSQEYQKIRDGVISKQCQNFDSEHMAEILAVTCESFFEVNMDDGFNPNLIKQLGTAIANDKENVGRDFSIQDALEQPCHIIETIETKYKIPSFFITLGNNKILRINDDFTGFCYKDKETLQHRDISNLVGYIPFAENADWYDFTVAYPATVLDVACFGGNEEKRFSHLLKRLSLFRAWLAEQGLFRKDKSMLVDWKPLDINIAKQPLHIFATQHDDFIGTYGEVYITVGNGYCLRIDRNAKHYDLSDFETILTDGNLPKSILPVNMTALSSVFIASEETEQIEYLRASEKGKVKILNRKLEDYLNGILYTSEDDENEIDKKLESLTSEQIEKILTDSNLPSFDGDDDDDYSEYENDDEYDDDDNDDC